MKKLYVLFSILSLLACSCDDDKNLDCTPQNYSNFYQENRAIAVAESLPLKYAIDDGGHLVFTYAFIDKQCADIAEDKYSENIFFELAPDVTEFSYEDEELYAIKAHFRTFGAWSNKNAITIKEGLISGKRVSSSGYHIKLDVLVNLENNNVKKITYESDFVLHTQD